MPYNLAIPGQVTEFQLRAIEAVATLVPEQGVAVEIGSLFGRSSVAWAKSVPASAVLHCIDPWVGNQGVRPMEQRHGITYGLEQFKAYTQDCPNIVPHQGYSPRDVQDWSRSIDLFYEDSVHQNPTLQENLDFWTQHLKPTGVACGDDFRPRFPDVMNGARVLADRLGRELITIDNFWCLLPAEDLVPTVGAVRDRLLALQSEAQTQALSNPFAHTFVVRDKPSALRQGEPLHLELHLCNDGPLPWLDAAGAPLSASVSIRLTPTETERPCAIPAAATWVLAPDIPVTETLRVPTNELAIDTWTLTLSLVLIGTDGTLHRLLEPTELWTLKILAGDPEIAVLPKAYQVTWEDQFADYQMIDRVDVHAAYRMLLGRPPEGGQDRVDRHLAAAKDLSGLRQRFMASPEFGKANFRLLAPAIIGRAAAAFTPQEIETTAPPAALARLLDHVQRVWSGLGEVEPHFSVLSTPQFKPHNLPDNEAAFYATGKAEVTHLLDRLRAMGVPPVPESHAVEFGCGVGRVTRFLADAFTQVTAFDISQPHLQLARQYLDHDAVRNVTLRRVDDIAGLEVPEHDVFYSKLVFQHNPPPVIRILLEKLLSHLRPGGVAVFQLVTAIDGYRFSTERYLANMDQLQGQELHAFPQSEVFRVCSSRGLLPVDVSRDTSVTGFDKVSHLFTVKRES
ncbi:class I SAM-dependent methyltransferase [uncultured Thiocystis sp.]|jgi:SAM-dependent methyltransferase|uniref:methyltransferase domain-containing protein n=1 Tax=uncultured Thiocystis sp. TaxID=1202134 RepID=UPI0025F2354C|nr:class I SAM-dependent methyltransferase [uncultured Thiocystis sp.]